MSTDAQDSMSIKHPQLLYKYLDGFGLDAVANLELKITPPNEFNDPLEFTPRIEFQHEAELRRYYESCVREGMPHSSFEQFKNERSAGKLCDFLQSEFRDLVSKQLTVLCMSKRPTITNQWSRYADAYRGLVLELNIEEEPFCTFSKMTLHRLFEVVYPTNEEKAAISPMEILELNADGSDPATTAEKIVQLLYRAGREKSEEWSKEEEWRMIVPILPAGIHQMETPPPVSSRMAAGRLLHFLKLSKEAINRVIVGAEATAEFEREVRKSAAYRGIPDERVVRAQLNRQSSRVEISWCDLPSTVKHP